MNAANIDGPTYGGLPDETPPTSLDSRPDNLSTMLFVAALFHGVLILGVSFTAGEGPASSTDSESMEVVLLNRDFEERPDSSDAEYLAQQNRAGAGNTEENDALRVAYGRDNEPLMPGPEQDGESQRPQTAPSATTAEQLLYARTREGGTMPEQAREQEQSAPMRTGLPGTANRIEILATPDDVTVMKGAQPRQLLISANTRESRIAAYLDGWKRRVERVGTINFPFDALRQPGIQNPVLEVSIASNGQLTDVIIVNGSGNRELDMAAVNILKMAAPFDRFPDYLINDYDSLKFSYEWQFTGSSVGRMTVP
jgi:protein TonB